MYFHKIERIFSSFLLINRVVTFGLFSFRHFSLPGHFPPFLPRPSSQHFEKSNNTANTINNRSIVHAHVQIYAHLLDYQIYSRLWSARAVYGGHLLKVARNKTEPGTMSLVCKLLTIHHVIYARARTYQHTCMPAHTYVRVCAHTHAREQVHVRTRTQAHTHTHAGVHTHTHGYAHTQRRECACTHVRTHTYAQVCTRAHTHSHIRVNALDKVLK